ncbi:MAG: Trm112 family protein [Myxococcota bacterium]
MPVSQELLEILVCPETKQPVEPASAELLERLAAAAAAGTLRNLGGEKIASAPREGLVRQDGKILYPVEDDIPVMLIEESIELS